MKFPKLHLPYLGISLHSARDVRHLARMTAEDLLRIQRWADSLRCDDGDGSGTTLGYVSDDETAYEIVVSERTIFQEVLL